MSEVAGVTFDDCHGNRQTSCGAKPLSSGLSVARDGDIHLYWIKWATNSCSLSRCGCALVLLHQALISHEERL